MPSPMSPAGVLRSGVRRLLGVTVALALSALSAYGVAEPAQADASVSPRSGSFAVRGAGWGHGWGMSQYGAYGAARKGLSWQEILAFYYTGTTVEKHTASTKLRVWITADSDGDLRVEPAAGLRVTDAAGHSVTLPTGAKYDGWRLTRSGSDLKLSYQTGSGSWVDYPISLEGDPWAFHTSAKIVRVVMPGGTVRPYRGYVSLVRRGTGARTVNTVTVESYVKGVVPAEMPTSWDADAVRAQAVAARSYALRLASFGWYDGADLCDTTSCQVYRGVSAETLAGDDAVLATAGKVVMYDGKIAYTQFASSNGGSSANGDFPYLKAKDDPYDDVVTSHNWSQSVSASSIRRAWPSVGAVHKLKITDRDGHGRWGGRVTKIKIYGSKGSVTVSGATFQSRFGLKSRLFTAAR